MLTGLLVLAACEKYTLTRVYRTQVLDYHGNHVRDTVPALPGKPVRDTFVYVAAVLVPGSYDWRKDESYGAVGCTVQLWKNNDLQFSSDAGPGTYMSGAPDSHHLTGGHLYTENCTQEGTRICRDGKAVLSYSQREKLRGLLEKDGVIYTLGRDLDSGGFCFRKDGEPLLKQNSGEIFGDFSNPSYGKGGALYENGDAVCFSFRNASTCYVVKNGEMQVVSMVPTASRVRDIRLFGEGIYYVADFYTSMMVYGPSGANALPSGINWVMASLFPRNDGMWVCAETSDYTYCCPVSGTVTGGLRFYGSGNFMYDGSSELIALGYEGGDYRISKSGGRVLYARDSTFLLSTASLACAGDRVYALVNPKEKDAYPFVWNEGRNTQFEMNGYLTAIEVEISPPR